MGVKSNLFRLKATVALGVIVNSMVLVLGAIAPSLSQTGIDNNDSGKVSLRMVFRNVRDYTKCLENVLLLYEKYEKPEEFTELSSEDRNKCTLDVAQVYEYSGLPPCEARRLIEEADIFATDRLRPPLFPDRGIRVRIAQNFGYLYRVDRDDRQILNVLPQPPLSCQ
mgnify:CR=1 FL=1